MAEDEQDSENKVLEDFELSSELSALTENNVIPKKISKRLEVRLKEKKVKITKKQLGQLAEKIRDIMREFVKDLPENQRQAIMGDMKSKEPDENTKKMLETIEKLQGKIGELENKKETLDYPQKSKEEKEMEPTTDIKKEEEKPVEEVQEMQPATEFKKEVEEKKPTIESKPPEKIQKITKSPRIVTTEDIKIPGEQKVIVRDWNLDPLIEIPGDTESIIILMKWLQNLIDKCGRPNLSNILDYYVDIGWISDDVKITLIDYSQGITGEERIGKTGKEISDLPSKDHIESLLFIQKLKGVQFDKHFIDRIEGEMSRITKKVSNYNIK